MKIDVASAREGLWKYFLDFLFCWTCTSCICVIKTNLMLCLSSVYFVTLRVSSIFVAHNQEVCCIYTTRTNFCRYIYSIPPDYGLQICPKHVQVDWRNKQRLNSASSWFLLHRFPLYFKETRQFCHIILHICSCWHPRNFKRAIFRNGVEKPTFCARIKPSFKYTYVHLNNKGLGWRSV